MKWVGVSIRAKPDSVVLRVQENGQERNLKGAGPMQFVPFVSVLLAHPESPHRA